MATAALKLLPGVDVNRTPTFNETAISSCNLIRFMKDRQDIALVQKLGGWQKYFPQPMPSNPRSLWAWQDVNHNDYLAVGCDTAASAGVGGSLIVISNGSSQTITPVVRQDDVAPSVTTSTVSSTVDIDDTGSNINNFTSVFVNTHISVGGIIVFGFYQCAAVSADQFSVNLTDTLGNPVFPTSNVSAGGAVAAFTTTNGSSSVNVALADHGYSVGSTYPLLVTTTVGGISLFGNYIVQAVVDADNFTIFAANEATSGATASINGGNAQYDFFIGLGPLPMGTGYGAGGYGVGGYGSGVSPTPTTGDNITATDWSLDNWGSTLVACASGIQVGLDGTLPIGSPVYVWSTLSNNPVAVAIPQGPVCNDGIFVAMPQRQIVAWGSTFTGIQDHLLLRWCDINDYTQWIAQPTNQAGSYRIPKGSRIVGCIQAAQQALVFTDLSVWAMQYINQPYVYAFNEIGTGCGLIAPKAAASLNGIVYWMSQSQFFVLAGNGVQPLYCPIWDQIFQQLDTSAVNKIRVAVNSRFNEVSWFFPSTSGGGEVDSYVKYNTLIGPVGGWDYGSLTRTAWLNQSVLGAPIGADANFFLQQHETANDADGQAMDSWFRTGYFELSEGNWQTFVDYVLPDMKFGMTNAVQNASILMTFYVAQYPGDTPLVLGPYTITQATQYISTRLRGRLVSIKLESNDVGSWWRLGAMRYRAIQDGRF